MPNTPDLAWSSLIAVTAAAETMVTCDFSASARAFCDVDPANGYTLDSYDVTFENQSPSVCPVTISNSDPRVAAAGVFTDAGFPDFYQGDVRVSNSPNFSFVQDAPIFFRPEDGNYVGHGLINYAAATGSDKCRDYIVYAMTQFTNGQSTGYQPSARVTATYSYFANNPDCSGGGGGDNMVIPASSPNRHTATP